MKQVIISADSTCDLGPELKERYRINFFPLHIVLDDKEYVDGVDIFPEDIYAAYERKGILPKTAAVNAEEYYAYFAPWVEKGYEVVHISLGSALSSSYQNSFLAAERLPGVYVVDSRNLSTGMGLLVLEAADRAEAGMCARQIAEEIRGLVNNCHASFVLSTLVFAKAGGRCSALAAAGANLLNIKPCIEVDPIGGGKLKIGKKYRGKQEKAVRKYVEDQLEKYPAYRRKRAFLTHSGLSEERISKIRKQIEETGLFDEILITQAGCTISAHCGPDCMGVLFMTE